MQSLIYAALLKAIGASLWLLRRIDRLRFGRRVRSDEAFRLSPYESYESLRAHGNIVRSYANQGWLVNGYEEVQQVLLDPRFSNDLRRNRFIFSLLKVASNGLDIPLIEKPAMLNRDRPDHTRLRKLVAGGFTNNYVQSLAPKILALVDEMLSSVSPGESFDLIATLAQPLPAMVIAEMMGVPEHERHLFQRWSEELTGATMIDNPALIEKAARADKAMRDYLDRLVTEKERSPDQGFISVLLGIQQDSDKLSRDELISNCILLLTAGHETTTRLIGNGLYTLLKHPQQLQALRDDPALIDGAIEEMLRFEPPIQMTIRFVAEDFLFFGHQLRKNQMMMVGIGAANRDPKFHANAQRFDIHRNPNRHIAFGYGIHLCLGMALARLEARIAFTRLLDRFTTLSLAEESQEWGSNPFFRGLTRLVLSTSSPQESATAAATTAAVTTAAVTTGDRTS